MPERQFITHVPGVQVQDVVRGKSIEIRGIAEVHSDTACPICGSSRFRIKATHERTFKHGLWDQRLVLLRVKIPKLFCKQCGRYFVYRIPGILPKKRSTEQFRQEVFHLHQGGLTQTRLSQSHAISGSTVERWYHDFVEYRVKELEGRLCPLVMGIDEHFFSRKDGYATTLVDLKNHKVFDVVLGRSEESLKAYLRRLKGRERVQVVVMDLSETYRSIVNRRPAPQFQIIKPL
jgi:transposase